MVRLRWVSFQWAFAASGGHGLTPAVVTQCLGRFKAVAGISVAGCTVGWAALLTGAPRSLDGLDLSFCDEVTTPALAGVAARWPNLRTLHLEDALGVTDHGVLAVVERCDQLRELTLDNADVTDAGVAAVAAHCPRLTALRLANSPDVTDAGAAAIGAGLPGLTLLALRYLPAVGPDGVGAVVRGCRRLAVLDLEGCPRVDDAAVAAVAAGCPALRGLNLFDCPRVTVIGLDAVRAGHPTLGRRLVEPSGTSRMPPDAPIAVM